MPPHIFITGISGYIGGQLLEDISSKHPDYQITGLVRNEDQGQKITAKYPTVRTVYGDLDSNDILVEESKKADVVLQTANSDHNPSVIALISVLSQGEKNGAFIQLSGAASIMDSSNGYGQPSTRIWDDVADLQEITAFDHNIVHAITDQLVLNEGNENAVRTAVVCPPMVYGKGNGPVKTTSMQLPWLVEAITKRGKAFTVGEGKHHVSVIHVKDLVDALIFLTEQALDPSCGKANWGSEGVYYVEAGSEVFTDVVDGIAKQMHEKGIIPNAEIDHLSVEEATQIHPWAAMVWGSNMRVQGSRLRSLGWKPKQPMVAETISECFA
jgi:nucleoside-diphosphate-sugar epimerase